MTLAGYYVAKRPSVSAEFALQTLSYEKQSRKVKLAEGLPGETLLLLYRRRLKSWALLDM